MLVNQVADDAASASGPAPVPYRRVRHLVISKREAAAGSGSTYFVKTSPNQVFQFGPEEHLLCQLLDGKRSLSEIQYEFKRQIGVELSREQFEGFLTEMLKCGILERAPVPQNAIGEPIEDERKAPQDEPADEIADRPVVLDAPQLPVRVRGRFAVRFFNPAGLLKAVDWFAGPLRFYRWLLWPLTLAGLLGAALSSEAMAADLSHLALGQAIAIVVAALLVVGLVPAIGQAAMASFFGYSSQVCGISFRFGLPRLRFSDADWGNLSATKALNVVGAPLTARLALFAGGTGIWLLTRQTGDWLPTLSLVVGQAALCAFLGGATPWAATTGRKWLTTLFGRTDLWRMGGSYRAHLLALSGLWGLACVGLISLYLAVAGHAGVLGAILSWLQLGAAAHAIGFSPSGLLPSLAQIALSLLTIAPFATWLWLRGTVKSHGVARVVYQPEEGLPSGSVSASALPAAKLPGVVVPFDREAAQGLVPTRRRQAEPWRSAKTVIVLATALALVEAFGLVPYPYEAGGNFVILPHDSSKLNARIQGELTEVLVNEGDKVVPGQIVGTLSDWDEQANLAVSKAQLQNATASLQALYETPKPEDAELARKQYELAVSKLAYDKAQYDRASVLVKTDAVSHSNYDQILSQYQQDQAAADVARANYDDVRSGPTPGQLDAARAMVRQYAAVVAYNEDQLDRTRIRATAFGTVVTPNPMLLRGQWFMQGQLVFTAQDLRTVQADVQVPETDIGNVQLGGAVRLRPWGYPETTFPGTAIAIAGDAQPDPGNSGTNIVRVRAELPNPDGALHANMTGYAKITGPYMPAWKSFVQMIIRFFLITIWSFVP